MIAAGIYGAQAQRLMGISTSNWGGTTGLALNPANLADNRARFVLDLGGLNFGVDNNLAEVDLSKVTGGTSAAAHRQMSRDSPGIPKRSTSLWRREQLTI